MCLMFILPLYSLVPLGHDDRLEDIDQRSLPVGPSGPFMSREKGVKEM